MKCTIFESKITLAVLGIWLMLCIYHCGCKTVRDLQSPNIKTLYQNVSKYTEEKRITMYGSFQCPQDTTAKINYGKVVKFRNVSGSKKGSAEFEIELNFGLEMFMTKLTLHSTSVSESLDMFLYEVVNHNAQNKISATNCLVGINSSSVDQKATYSSFVQNCDQGSVISEEFVFGLNITGEIIKLSTFVYCYPHVYPDYTKYFESRCHYSPSTEPLSITFNKEELDADNVDLVYLNYKFQPMEPDCDFCLSYLKRWIFEII